MKKKPGLIVLEVKKITWCWVDWNSGHQDFETITQLTLLMPHCSAIVQLITKTWFSGHLISFNVFKSGVA